MIELDIIIETEEEYIERTETEEDLPMNEDSYMMGGSYE